MRGVKREERCEKRGVKKTVKEKEETEKRGKESSMKRGRGVTIEERSEGA